MESVPRPDFYSSTRVLCTIPLNFGPYVFFLLEKLRREEMELLINWQGEHRQSTQLRGAEAVLLQFQQKHDRRLSIIYRNCSLKMDSKVEQLIGIYSNSDGCDVAPLGAKQTFSVVLLLSSSCLCRRRRRRLRKCEIIQLRFLYVAHNCCCCHLSLYFSSTTKLHSFFQCTK